MTFNEIKMVTALPTRGTNFTLYLLKDAEADTYTMQYWSDTENDYVQIDLTAPTEE